MAPLRCWRLYTESAYVSEMLTMTIPEIQRTVAQAQRGARPCLGAPGPGLE